MTHINMYCDGSSRGNPGKGGFGTRIEYTDKNGQLHVKECSQGYKLTTNNRMELMGVIAGLESLKYPCEVDVYSDSQYVIKAFQDHWIDGWIKRNWKNSSNEPVKNVDLWKKLINLVSIHKISWHWVKGHNGNQGNERCDELATAAADSDKLIIDIGMC